MERARRRWREWDALIQSGAQPMEIIPTLGDDALVELLSASAAERQYERNVLMTELLNRATRRARLVASALESLAAAEDVLQAAVRAGAPAPVLEAAKRALEAAARLAEDAAAAAPAHAAPEAPEQ